MKEIEELKGMKLKQGSVGFPLLEKSCDSPTLAAFRFRGR